MITFDELLQTITREKEPELGYENFQGNVHAIFALIYLWQNGDLTNGQVVEILNLDNTDPELSTVRTYLNSLNKAETLALQSDGILSELRASATGIDFNKAHLRASFGLS